jgi:hypothetical protein
MPATSVNVTAILHASLSVQFARSPAERLGGKTTCRRRAEARRDHAVNRESGTTFCPRAAEERREPALALQLGVKASSSGRIFAVRARKQNALGAATSLITELPAKSWHMRMLQTDATPPLPRQQLTTARAWMLPGAAPASPPHR